MLGETAGLVIVFVALGAFAAIGVRGARAHLGRDGFLTARGTQSPRSLGLSFFASALGTWIVVAPPIVGTFAGLLGILGYALGQAAAVGVYAWLGPAVRRRMPEGTTVLEFVEARFGRLAQAVTGGVSVLYMFLFLVVELASIGLILQLTTGVGTLVPIVAVAVATTAYTAYGGLPASLATDRWQAALILGLVAAVVVAIATEVPDPAAALGAGGIAAVTRVGWEAFGVLMIAVIAANLFHQGFWQRVWAGRDDRAVASGAWGGAALILPLVFLMGALGAMAAGDPRELLLAEVGAPPPLPFFQLLRGSPAVVIGAVVALGVSLVASTTDTLQNALASIVARDVGGGRIGLAGARWVTVGLMVPAVWVALEGVDVLRVFLVADLLAAAIALPIFLGLRARTTSAGMLAGVGAGLLGVVAVGWIDGGSLADGLLLLTLPEGLYAGPALGAFLAAPLASGLVTLAVSAASPRAEGPSPAGARQDPPTSSSR